MGKIFDVATMIVVVAGIMVMVRPGSKGPDLVSAIGSAFSGSLLAATGSAPGGWTNQFV
ncbi:MAG: hypothetical protein JSR64_17055 [Nitrospira sp.]|nr:hypothetical protein [Nitrospira sp.]